MDAFEESGKDQDAFSESMKDDYENTGNKFLKKSGKWAFQLPLKRCSLCGNNSMTEKIPNQLAQWDITKCKQCGAGIY